MVTLPQMQFFQLRRISKSWMLIEIMYLTDGNAEVQLLSFSVHQLPSIISSLEVLHPRRGAPNVNVNCYSVGPIVVNLMIFKLFFL